MDTRRGFYEIYWKIRRIIAPSLRSSQRLYEDILKSHVNPSIKWLDSGCGHQILPPWRSEEEEHLARNCRMIVGIDYDLRSLKSQRSILLKVRGDIAELPFKSNSFDLVTANMVVEHLENPDVQFQEVRRILKPRGIFIFHTPNTLSYMVIMGRLVPDILRNRIAYLLQGAKEEDIFKTYYRANTRKRVSNLARVTGFEVVEIKMATTSPSFIVIPPLLVFELIWKRILMTKLFEPFRADIIAILRKK